MKTSWKRWLPSTKAAGIGTILYSATVTLTALLAPTAQRRRDARAVLAILLRRHRADDDRPR